jgi:hypothetical protein
MPEVAVFSPAKLHFHWIDVREIGFAVELPCIGRLPLVAACVEHEKLMTENTPDLDQSSLPMLLTARAWIEYREIERWAS